MQIHDILIIEIKHTQRKEVIKMIIRLKLKEESHQKYLTRLVKAEKELDPELAHGEADTILCELLKEIGLKKIVSKYAKINKWYA